MANRIKTDHRRAIVGALLAVLAFPGCTGSSAETSPAPSNDTVSASSDTVSASSDTVSASSNTVSASTVTALATTLAVPTTTVAPTTTSSTTTTTTTIAPVTTIPHGSGPILTAADGSTVDPDAAKTAKAIYDAAIVRDYDAIKAIIGKRRFRWGFVGQRRPADQWQKEFDEGGADALARMIALLDVAPTVDKRGNTVWPYLATKDPAEWNEQDLLVLATLGFRTEDIEATRFKGVYKDYRLIIGPDGVWTAFGVGY